ncbi:MAG: hypothetical protein V1837_07180 [Candidatus Woesearchaeota archaeon]
MKKAELKLIVILVLMLVCISVMILFEGSVSKLFASSIDSTGCKANVIEHAAAHLKIVDLSSDITCPAENITLRSQDPKAQLADSMYKCWDNWGKGKLDLFANDGVYCVVCSWVKSKDKSMTLTGFDNYLSTTIIPGRGITYLDFLNGYETPRGKEVVGNLLEKQSQNPSVIFGDKTYSVIFVYARGDEFIKKLLVTSASTVGLPVIIAGGIMVVAGLSGVGIPFVLSAGALTVAGSGTALLGGIEAWYEAKLRMERPDHVAFVALREYNSGQLDELGCKSLPAKQ